MNKKEAQRLNDVALNIIDLAHCLHTGTANEISQETWQNMFARGKNHEAARKQWRGWKEALERHGLCERVKEGREDHVILLPNAVEVAEALRAKAQAVLNRGKVERRDPDQVTVAGQTFYLKVYGRAVRPLTDREYAALRASIQEEGRIEVAIVVDPQGNVVDEQWGVHVGTTSPGSSPTEVGYSVRTRIEKDERSTTYRASARGPGALAWVEGRRPGGPIETSELFHEEAIRYVEGTWVVKEPTPDEPDKPEGVRWQIQTEISGGHVDFDFEPVVGGFEPVLFEGAILPWRLSVAIKGRKRGGEGKPEELKLPGVLPAPWLLDRNSSREKDPFVAEFGTDADSHLWAREANLVYWAKEKPSESPAKQLRASQPVASYYL